MLTFPYRTDDVLSCNLVSVVVSAAVYMVSVLTVFEELFTLLFGVIAAHYRLDIWTSMSFV